MSEIFKPKPSSLEVIEKGLKRLEQELFRECSEVVYSSVAHTFEVDPASAEMPAEWRQELDSCGTAQEREQKELELLKRHRIALAAWQSPKNAPVALQIAAKVLCGMQKAHAADGNGNRTLNVNVVTINAPMPVFEEKEIDIE